MAIELTSIELIFHFKTVGQSGSRSIYCRANQEWQWRNILFSIVKVNINLHTPLELTGIDSSHVY